MKPSIEQHGVYVGELFHRRFTPKNHQFTYPLTMFWLDLQDSDFSSHKTVPLYARWVKFCPDDYLANESAPLSREQRQPLKQKVLAKMSELSDNTLVGNVYFLGQVRNLGCYFSPINLFYLKQGERFTHVLTEVSNTPWNQRHYYLIHLDNQTNTPKAFHVSPFNHMDMDYKWHIPTPKLDLSFGIDCIAETKIFSASMKLHKKALTLNNLKALKWRMLLATIVTVFGIYWQALKLFVKRVPFYGYPNSATNAQHNNTKNDK